MGSTGIRGLPGNPGEDVSVINWFFSISLAHGHEIHKTRLKYKLE